MDGVFSLSVSCKASAPAELIQLKCTATSFPCAFTRIR